MSTAPEAGTDKPMINILFAAHPSRWNAYAAPLRTALDALGLTYTLSVDLPPDQVDYIIYAPNSSLQDFRPYSRLKAVLNLWAGVEAVIGNDTLKVPLVRMVETGMTQGMMEWVVGHTLRHHLGMDAHITGQDGIWRAGNAPPLASQRGVTVLGLGELGGTCAAALAALNFDVVGWSRSAKSIPGVRSLTGAQGLDAALAHGQIVILLTPWTSATENLLNADTLAKLPRGAVIINPGRGGLIDDAALLAALDTGHIGHATLDVFRTEPLPADNPYWAHPRVTVTPHIASETRVETASAVIADTIHRNQTGQPLLHVVNRADR
jgi:glyoxylate/hydroxypyruvate reductase A